MSRSVNAQSSADSRLSDILGIVVEKQTYRNLLYLSLAFPLGIAYFVFISVGFALGLSLSVLVIGLGILFGTVVGMRAIVSFERTLANRLLGCEIAAPTDHRADSSGLIERVKAYLRADSTWRGLGFVFLKFWIGVLSFILLVSFLGTAIELLVLPVRPEGVLNMEVWDWEVSDTFSTQLQRVIAVPIGAVLGVFALHLLNAFAEANAAIASSLLGPEEPNPDP